MRERLPCPLELDVSNNPLEEKKGYRQVNRRQKGEHFTLRPLSQCRCEPGKLP